MRVITLLFSIVLFSHLSAQVVYEEYFDNGMPTDYNLINLDELTPDDPDLVTMADSAWTTRFISAQGFGGGNGSDCAFSVSWYVGDEGPSDDWMALPAITLGADPYLNWSGMAITSSGDFRDQYQVFVVTTGNSINDYILAAPIFDTGNTGEEIEETYHSLSLSDFAGQTVYPAFRNFTQPYDSDQPTGPGNGGNELAIDNIVVSNGPLGLNEDVLTDDLLILPNPVSDGVLELRFTPKTDELLTVDILDISGRLIKRLAQVKSTQNVHTIREDVSGLSSGEYLLRITDGRIAQSQKVIIE